MSIETNITEQQELFEALPPMQKKKVAFAIGRYQPPTGYTGYVYLWFDTKRKMFYVGSHLGSLEDNYLCSNKRCKRAILSRPESFRFRVLEYTFENSFQLRQTETKWLQMIRPEELNVKYYNLKRVAFGGNIYADLSEEKKLQHRIKTGEAVKQTWATMSAEEYEYRQKNAFGGNTFNRDYMKTAEYRASMSLATLGEKNGFYGKTHSEELKRNVAERSLGNEYRAKTYRLSKEGQCITFSNITKYIKNNKIPSIKYGRYLNTNKPIHSHKQPNHPWTGFTIEII